MCVWLWNTWNNPYATDTYLFPILLSLFSFSLLIFLLLFVCTLFCFGHSDFWFLGFVRSCRVCFSFSSFQFISLFTFLWIVGFCELEFKAPCTIRPALTQKSTHTHTYSRSAEERKTKHTNEWIDESQRQPLLNLLARLFALSYTICTHSVKEACTQMNKKIRIEKEKPEIQQHQQQQRTQRAPNAKMKWNEIEAQEIK